MKPGRANNLHFKLAEEPKEETKGETMAFEEVKGAE